MRLALSLLKVLLASACLASCSEALHEDMGKRLEEQGEPEQAIAEYRKAVEQDPQSKTARFRLGRALFRTGELGEAEAELKECLRLDSTSFEAHLLLAETLLARKNYRAAATEFAVASVYRPADPRPALGTGRCLDDLGDREGAIGQYRKAIALDPACADAYEKLSIALDQAGKKDESRQAMEKAIKIREKSGKE